MGKVTVFKRNIISIQWKWISNNFMQRQISCLLQIKFKNVGLKQM